MLDGRNYLRNTIKALAKINKPFIVSGRYTPRNGYDYVTYTNIRPYIPEGANTNQICDHINVMREDVEKYIDVGGVKGRNPLDYLVCRAKEYRGEDGTTRGGIILTDELGIPPVLCAEYPSSRKIIESVDKDKYVDFFSFAEGRYAFYGPNLWKNGHKRKLLSWGEQQKQLKKKSKPKGPGQPPMDALEFMAEYNKENPLWIPPPADLKHIDFNEFVHQYIPQKHLRDILFSWPSLRKEVMQEFIKRM